MKKVYMVLNYVMFKILNLDTLKFLSLKNLQHMLTRERDLTYGTKESYMVLNDVMFKILNLDMLKVLSLKNLQHRPVQDGQIAEVRETLSVPGDICQDQGRVSWKFVNTHLLTRFVCTLKILEFFFMCLWHSCLEVR